MQQDIPRTIPTEVNDRVPQYLRHANAYVPHHAVRPRKMIELPMNIQGSSEECIFVYCTISPNQFSVITLATGTYYHKSSTACLRPLLLLQITTSRNPHPQQESRLLNIMMLITTLVSQVHLYRLTLPPPSEVTYLKIPTPPGSNIIGSGNSSG